MEARVHHATETWLPVVGWEDRYLVSDQWRIWSVWSKRTIKLQLDKDGYLCIMLCRNGYAQLRKVHLIVLEAFKGACPPGLQARHLDGIKIHCAPENLEWGTGSENTKDQIRHGTHHEARKPVCGVCGGEYRTKKNGKRECIECKKRYRRDALERNPDAVRATKRAWRANNRDKVNAQKRAAYLAKGQGSASSPDSPAQSS